MRQTPEEKIDDDHQEHHDRYEHEQRDHQGLLFEAWRQQGYTRLLEPCEQREALRWAIGGSKAL